MPIRFKAFGVHLLISAVIALAVVALVFGLWYPAPLAAATGVTGIFLILLGVDVCLGPLLTLVVYKPGKKTLVMDLTVIALLQVAALAYGVFTVAQGRPAWVVFSVDRFELVRINDIDDRKLDEAQPQYQRPSWLGPQWVAAVSPNDADSRNTLMFEAVLGGVDASARPNLYAPLEGLKTQVIKHAQPLSALEKVNHAEDVEHALAGLANIENLAWLPLRANVQDMVVLVNNRSGEVVKTVDLRPW